MEVRQKVERALKQYFSPTLVDVEDDEGIIGIVVAERFRRMQPMDRQVEIRSALRRPEAHLSKNDLRQVLIIVPLTPEEYVAYGPSNGGRKKKR